MKNNQYSLADIEAAVSAGVLDRAAYVTLAQFLTSHAPEAIETEKFTLFRGMNDIFLALGITVLSIGWFILWGLYSNDAVFWIAPLVAMAGFVVLAEYVAGKLKATLPSIVIMVSLCATLMIYAVMLYMRMVGTSAEFFNLDDVWSFGSTSVNTALLVAIIGFAFQVGFFLRYRLPVSFALIAFGIVGVLWSLLLTAFGQSLNQYLDYMITLTGLLLLALGVVVDTKDPKRVNGWAECAFWLYVIGAPMTIHSVAALFDAAALVMIPVIIIAMLFSLFLDRRSPIISGLIYVGYLANSGFNQAAIDPSITVALVCFVVGGLVMAFGFGWQKARHIVLSPFEDQNWRRYLPPT